MVQGGLAGSSDRNKGAAVLSGKYRKHKGPQTHVVLRRQQGALCGRSEIIKERVIADAVKEEAGGHSKAFDVRPERDRSHGKYLSRGAAHSDLGFNEIATEHD